jgi:hypothetical protein|tara:strand:- start:219 stop:683 length:465 start_codon:yes stop_codon:yes gene_type:complete
MAVLLRDTPPPFQEVGALGRECVPVYAFMWESAARDERGDRGKKADRGGTCHWTVKGLANQCSMSRTTVIAALKKLLDHGFIQFAEFSTPYDRVWRVTHPKHLEAVRYSIEIMGLPSLRYNNSTRSRHDKTELGTSEKREVCSKASRLEKQICR